MSIDVGSTYQATYVVARAGVPTTAGTCSLTVTVGLDTPDTPAVPPPAAESPGLYVVDYPILKAGLYRFAWATTGPTTSKLDYQNARLFASVLGLDESREWLGIQDTRADSRLRSAMAAATRAAESIVGTMVIRAFTGDWIPGTSRPVIRLPHGPLPNDSAVTKIYSIYDGGPVWTADDLIVNPDAGTVYPKDMIDFWYGPWRADYTGGRLELGENLIAGTREILWDLWATQRNLFGDQDEPGLEEVAAFEGGFPPGYRVPGRALEYLEDDRMPGFG